MFPSIWQTPKSKLLQLLSTCHSSRAWRQIYYWHSFWLTSNQKKKKKTCMSQNDAAKPSSTAKKFFFFFSINVLWIHGSVSINTTSKKTKNFSYEKKFFFWGGHLEWDIKSMFGGKIINIMLLSLAAAHQERERERRHSRRSEQQPNLLGWGDNDKLAWQKHREH